jgi:hypothetical protein
VKVSGFFLFLVYDFLYDFRNFPLSAFQTSG